MVINLQRAGYTVVDVGCGEDALRVFDEANGDFDIALLDIMMPGIDGFTVCKKLREKSSTIGIIMLTARTQPAPPARSGSLHCTWGRVPV